MERSSEPRPGRTQSRANRHGAKHGRRKSRADSGKREMDMDNTNGSLKSEVIKAAKENPDLTYAEIGELYDLPSYRVASLARSAGIFRNRRRSKAMTEGELLDDEIRQAEQKLAELRRQKALTEIRLERDGSKVAVYGLGAQPLVAEHRDWLRFLRKNGAAMLREFIEAEFTSAKGNGNGTIQ